MQSTTKFRVTVLGYLKANPHPHRAPRDHGEIIHYQEGQGDLSRCIIRFNLHQGGMLNTDLPKPVCFTTGASTKINRVHFSGYFLLTKDWLAH